jgi:hypothetical protein
MRTRSVIWLLLAAALLSSPLAESRSPSSAHRHLIVLIDGLRPDYVTSSVMPNLAALGGRGVVFTHHHSVYPTVTRVNASSISTGAYPETHGLLGNSVFFPAVDPERFLDTANRDHLAQIASREPRLLTAPTMGELLQATGRNMLVVSSGSEGSALLNNHTVAGGAILHAQFALPERMREEMKVLAPPPGQGAPAGARDRYAVDALLRVGIPRIDPTVTILWLGELDSTAHEKGIGAPETIAVLRNVDGEIGRVEAALRAARLLDTYNIWVTSDHGFTTHTGGPDLSAVLAPFAGTLSDRSPSVVLGGGAIYLRGDSVAKAGAIVSALQRTPGVGAIFTAALGRVARRKPFGAASRSLDHRRLKLPQRSLHGPASQPPCDRRDDPSHHRRERPAERQRMHLDVHTIIGLDEQREGAAPPEVAAVAPRRQQPFRRGSGILDLADLVERRDRIGASRADLDVLNRRTHLQNGTQPACGFMQPHEHTRRVLTIFDDACRRDRSIDGRIAGVVTRRGERLLLVHSAHEGAAAPMMHQPSGHADDAVIVAGASRNR